LYNQQHDFKYLEEKSEKVNLHCKATRAIININHTRYASQRCGPERVIFMSNKTIFNKSALPIAEQIDLLKHRNLTISDDKQAHHFLETIGYYRLTAYFKPFMLDPNNADQGFKPGTYFSHILDLYVFDRELRLLVTDALERIEVALRATLSNVMSIQHGPHWYLEPDLFSNPYQYQAFLQEATEHLSRSKEAFIQAYYQSHHNPKHPPSWMVMECLSFGTVSKMYANIKHRTLRKQVGDKLGQFSEVIKSWMKALTYTRNICAHHARLWDRFFC